MMHRRLSCLLQTGVAFTAFAVFFATPAYASSTSQGNHDELDAKYVRYLKDNDTYGGFKRNRGLKDCENWLTIKGLSLSRVIHGLPQGSVWFDNGAGEAGAQIDAMDHDLFPNISKYVAVSYNRPDSFKLDQAETRYRDRFHYVSGDFIENLYQDGKLDSYIDKVDILHETFGPANYAKDLGKILFIDFALLKRDRFLFLNMMKSTSTSYGNNPTINSFFASGSEIDFVDALRSIQGVSVLASEVKVRKWAGGYEEAWVVLLKKEAARVELPQWKTIEYTETGTTPRRVILVDEKRSSSTPSLAQSSRSSSLADAGEGQRLAQAIKSAEKRGGHPLAKIYFTDGAILRVALHRVSDDSIWVSRQDTPVSSIRSYRRADISSIEVIDGKVAY